MKKSKLLCLALMLVLLFAPLSAGINTYAYEDKQICDEGVKVETELGTIYATSKMLIKGEAKIRTLANDLKLCDEYASEIGPSYDYWNQYYKEHFSGKSAHVTDLKNDILYINFSELDLDYPAINIGAYYRSSAYPDTSGVVGFILTEEEIERGSISMTLPEMLKRCNYTYNDIGDYMYSNWDNFGLWQIRIGDANPLYGSDCEYAIDDGYIYLNYIDENSQGGNGFMYIEPDAVSVNYMVHRQTYGWEENWISDGGSSGTVGEGKRLEGIKIKMETAIDMGIEYRTHIQSYGWENEWKSNGEMSGTSGESKRLEAIQIRLTGSSEITSQYNVWYRVHAQTYGWLGWVCNGAPAGTSGYGKRLEAIQILVLPASELPTGGYLFNGYIDNAKNPSVNEGMAVSYMTHVQGYGDQNYVGDGSVSGTFGEAKRLEGIRIKLDNDHFNNMLGGIEYRTHVQTYGWLDWTSNGEFNGTAGESKRLEAIEIKLTGDLAEYYDVYYRVHSQTFGWLGWAKNGEASGTQGYGKRLEGIQIMVVPKGTGEPGLYPALEGTKSFIGTN